MLQTNTYKKDNKERFVIKHKKLYKTIHQPLVCKLKGVLQGVTEVLGWLCIFRFVQQFCTKHLEYMVLDFGFFQSLAAILYFFLMELYLCCFSRNFHTIFTTMVIKNPLWRKNCHVFNSIISKWIYLSIILTWNSKKSVVQNKILNNA